jgi:signal transduction histidine kinase
MGNFADIVPGRCHPVETDHRHSVCDRSVQVMGAITMEDKAVCSSELRELERLAVLEASALLDSSPDETFDQFTRLVSTILEAPVALVSLVDRDRQFFKSCVGLPEPWASDRQTPLSHSFCQYVVSSSEPLIVADARTHSLLKDNLAIADLGVVAYLGIPLTTAQGHTLGSLCAIDLKPREWTGREIGILRDLAQLVIEKIEVCLLARQLHCDYVQLRSLEMYREEMVQMLVHDLRNPLSSFMSGLELMQTLEPLPQEQQDYLDLAVEGGEMLLQMVNSILDANRTDVAQVGLVLGPVVPAQLMECVCRHLSPLAELAGVELRKVVVDEVGFMADGEKLCRVLMNLVSNAIQHTPPEGEVKILFQVEAGSGVRFSVTDTGRGIPVEAFGQIFQKFGRLDDVGQAAVEMKASTGLGLPFSRMVVEAHGGRLWVESQLGQGTSFHFTIPGQALSSVALKTALSSH